MQASAHWHQVCCHHEMQYELWNTRNGLRVATWPSEADAAHQIRRQRGLASEPVQLLVHSDNGATEVLADETTLLSWAEASTAPSATDVGEPAGSTAPAGKADSDDPTAGAPADGPRDPRVLLRNAIAQSRAATASVTGQADPAAMDRGGVEAIQDLSNPDDRVIGTAGGATGATPTTSIETVGDGRT